MRRKVAVLGATGVVGHQFVSMLAGHPYFEIEVLAASEHSAGKKYRDGVEHILSDNLPESIKKKVVEEIDPESLRKRGIGVVFSALPSGIAKNVESDLIDKGFAVFSNANAFRMEKDVPIVIPEVNAEHLRLIDVQWKKKNGFIVTDSNCTTAGLVVTLKPLMTFGIKEVTVTTYQSVSGAGYPGESALDMIGNVVPYIESEEGKVETEVKKILGTLSKDRIRDAPFDINATCVRVPVHYGHLESVVLRTEKKVKNADISKAFQDFRGVPQDLRLPTAPERPIIVRSEENRPQPLFDALAGAPERAKGMAVSVGRIAVKGDWLRFVLLSHNTIRGAAGTSILNAEVALKWKYI